jgi:hypothetical protein
VLELDCKLAGNICLLYFHREIDQSIHQSVISYSLSTPHPAALVLISLLNLILPLHQLPHHRHEAGHGTAGTPIAIRSVHFCMDVTLELDSIYVRINVIN